MPQPERPSPQTQSEALTHIVAEMRGCFGERALDVALRQHSNAADDARRSWKRIITMLEEREECPRAPKASPRRERSKC